MTYNPEQDAFGEQFPELLSSLVAFEDARNTLNRRLFAELDSQTAVAQSAESDEMGMQELACETAEAFTEVAIQVLLISDREDAVEQIINTWRIDSRERAELVRETTELDAVVELDAEDIIEILDEVVHKPVDNEQLGSLIGAEYLERLLADLDEYVCLQDDELTAIFRRLGKVTKNALDGAFVLAIEEKLAELASMESATVILPETADKLRSSEETAAWN